MQNSLIKEIYLITKIISKIRISMLIIAAYMLMSKNTVKWVGRWQRNQLQISNKQSRVSIEVFWIPTKNRILIMIDHISLRVNFHKERTLETSKALLVLQPTSKVIALTVWVKGIIDLADLVIIVLICMRNTIKERNNL